MTTYVVPGTVQLVVSTTSALVVLDLGWDITLPLATVKLTAAPAGQTVSAALSTLAGVQPGTPVVVHSFARDRYGRALAAITPAPKPKTPRTYVVPGTVLRVIDGDTISAALDLGWGITLAKATIRLAGCDAPEIATDPGKAAAAYTRGLLPAGAPIVVRSHSRDKYGRVLGAVDADGRDVAGSLLTGGYARPYDGGAR